MQRVLLVIAILLVSTSCGSDTTVSEPEALALAAEDALATLDDAELLLVEFEATWMCDAQRRSSVEPGVVDDARRQALEDSDLSADDYAAFRAALDERVELRQAVLARFVTICDFP